MEALSTVLLIIYAVIGGASTLYLLFGMPVIIIWKILRAAKYHIRLRD